MRINHEPTKNSASRILFYNNHANKQTENEEYRLTTRSTLSQNLANQNKSHVREQAKIKLHMNPDSLGFYNHSNKLRLHFILLTISIIVAVFNFKLRF